MKKINRYYQRNRLFTFILALVLLFSSIPVGSVYAVSQSEINELKEKRDELRSQAEAMQAGIDQLRQEQATVAEQKEALDAQNAVYAEEITLIEEEITTYRKMISEKGEELEAVKAAEAEQHQAFKVRIRAMEESGPISYWTVLFKASSFAELLDRMNMIQEIAEADQRMIDEYAAAREKTEQVMAEYQQVLSECTEQQERLESEKAALEAKIDEANQLILDYEKQISEDYDLYLATIAEEEAMNAEIKDLIAQYQREQEELRRQEEERKKQEAQQNQPGGGQNNSGTITSTGSYIWPLPGYKPGSAYGWRIHPIYNERRFHSGEDIPAPGGTPIKAADGGKVIMAKYNGGYGNCVMIDHGDGRVTLYAHMSGYAVSYGDTVTQGQTIGYVGTTGTSTGNHLHFEVRVNGNTTDPKSYFNF